MSPHRVAGVVFSVAFAALGVLLYFIVLTNGKLW